MDALGDSARFFSLTIDDLDSTLSNAPCGLYDAKTMCQLMSAAALAFRGPCLIVAEVGRGQPGCRGKLHLHAIAHRDDGPQHIPRESQRCQPIYDIFGIYRYLHKTPERWSLEAELDATAARVLSPSRRLPNTRRTLLTAERLAWLEARYCLKNQSPPQTIPKPNPEPQPDASAGTTPEATRAPVSARPVSSRPVRSFHPLIVLQTTAGTDANLTRQAIVQTCPIRRNERNRARGPPHAPAHATSDHRKPSLTQEMETPP